MKQLTLQRKEQVTVVMRRIDLVVYEEFLGLYTVPRINAATPFDVIKRHDAEVKYAD
jgi:hypothetical protein